MPPAVPVMLVHGFLAGPTLMTPMRLRLSRTRPVVTPDLSLLAIQDVRQLGGQLDLAVDRARISLRTDRVDVVGVSQGGIIALWWAHHLDGFARMRRLVLVGAPVRGSWAALLGLPLLGHVSGGIWQLLPNSAFTRNEICLTLPEGAQVTTISAAGDLVCPPRRCALPGATNLVLEGPPGPWKHQWMPLSRRVVSAVVEALDAPTPPRGEASDKPAPGSQEAT